MKQKIFMVVLALVMITNIGQGLIAYFGTKDFLTRAMLLVYGTHVQLDPLSHYLIRIIGAFLIGVGIFAAIAFKNPVNNLRIVQGLAAVLILRVLQRAFFTDQVHEVFGISYPRIALQGGLFLLLAFILVAFHPASKLFKSKHNT